MANVLTDLLKRKGATPGTASPVVPDETTQITQVVEEIQATTAFRDAIRIFRGNDQVKRAEWTPYPAMISHGIVRLDGDWVLITSFGRKVIEAVPVLDMASAQPSNPRPNALLSQILGPKKPGAVGPPSGAPVLTNQKDRLRTLSPQFTRAQSESLDALENVTDAMDAILSEKPDGSVDQTMRTVFTGMVSEARARITRERKPVSVEGPIDIVDYQPFVVDDPSQDNNVSLADWWRSHVGEEWDQHRTQRHQVAIDENGNDVLYELLDNGLVVVSGGGMHVVLATPVLSAKFLKPIRPLREVIANGVGSTINPPDGPGPDAPDVDDAAKPKGPEPLLLPDGRDALRLSKKDLVDAHAAVFSNVLEGSPAVKVYREFSGLPAKGRTSEVLLRDLRLMLALMCDSSEWRQAAEAWRNTYMTPSVPPPAETPPAETAPAVSLEEAKTSATTLSRGPTLPAHLPADVSGLEHATTTPTGVSDVHVAVSPEAIETVLADEAKPAAAQSAATFHVSMLSTAPSAMVDGAMTLYINCRPMRGGVVDLADFLRPYEAKVAAEHEVPYYMALPYKDGAKAVVTALAIAANRGELVLPSALYCDKHHPAYDEAVAFLSGYAVEVVRPCY